MTAEMTDVFDRGVLGPRRASSSPPQSAESDGIDLQDLLRGVWRGRYVIIAFALAFAMIAALVVSQITPRYAAFSQVLLDPRERRVFTNAQVVSDLKLSDQVLASEMSIMRSNVLIELVIEQIDNTAPGALSVLDPVNDKPSLLSRLKNGVKSVLGLGTADEAEAEAMALQARIDRLTWAVRRNVDIWRDGDAYIINIRAETVDPELSALLVSTLAEQYIAQQLEGRQQTATQATQRIEHRVEDLRVQVKIAEDAVEDYRAQSLVEHGSSIDIITQRMLSLNDELVNARVARLAAESRYNEIARLIDQGGFASLGSMLTSESITDLNAQRLDILRSDAQWAERFDTGHPERRKLANQLQEVDRALTVEFQRALDAQRNEVQIARISEETLRETLNLVEQQFLEVSRSSIGLRQLEREADAARTAYKELLNRVSETRTQEGFQQADARIIERATVPSAPSAPRPRLMTMLGFLTGGALGLGFVMFRHMTTYTYRGLAELEQDTGLPVLTVLAEQDWTSTRDALAAVSDDTMGPVAESIRTLRNELSLGNGDEEPQSVALLSALPGEGKTTTTVLLARLSEMADKLVIVVDCDLRQSTLQNEYTWHMPHDFEDLIRGNCTVLDAIQTDTGLGFDVLAARTVAPDAADLLRADWLHTVLEELKAYYDVVLVNCPPLLPVADTLVLARAVDQRLLLVRHNDTPRSAVKRCLSMLANNSLDISGQVLTRVDPDQITDSYAHSYGYYQREA